MLKFARLFVSSAALLTYVYAVPVAAQILNSERIEQTFGSYGIDVIYSDESLRVSNLYSEHGGEKITRTLAFVEYPEIVNPAFATEHHAILNGGSIGSTFQAAGWEVIKNNLSIVELAAADPFAAWLGVEPGAPLATHFYQLEVARNGQQFRYALLAEMHHPDYLSERDLTSIYPLNVQALTGNTVEPTPEREEILRRNQQLLNRGLVTLRELELTLSQ